MNSIILLDRTLNNGLHHFKPNAGEEIYQALQNAGIDWIDRDGIISPLAAKRVTQIKEASADCLFEIKQCNFLSDSDAIELFDKLAALKPFAVTLGGFQNIDDMTAIKRMALLADNHLPKEIAMGVNLVDSMSMSMTLALQFIKLNLLKRQCYLECSLGGVGDSCERGLLHTQSIVEVLNHSYREPIYNGAEFPNVITKLVYPLFAQRPWGYCNYQQLEYQKKLSEGKGVAV